MGTKTIIIYNARSSVTAHTPVINVPRPSPADSEFSNKNPTDIFHDNFYKFSKNEKKTTVWAGDAWFGPRQRVKLIVSTVIP